MAATNLQLRTSTDDLVAGLADAAYRVSLRHGLTAPFLDVELELWRALRAAFQEGVISSANGKHRCTSFAEVA